jgi:hypothetical protein
MVTRLLKLHQEFRSRQMPPMRLAIRNLPLEHRNYGCCVKPRHVYVESPNPFEFGFAFGDTNLNPRRSKPRNVSSGSLSFSFNDPRGLDSLAAAQTEQYRNPLRLGEPRVSFESVHGKAANPQWFQIAIEFNWPARPTNRSHISEPPPPPPPHENPPLGGAICVYSRTSLLFP